PSCAARRGAHHRPINRGPASRLRRGSRLRARRVSPRGDREPGGANHPSLEIIVVDDGSTPPCRATCDAYPAVRYAAQEHGGPAAARNTGVELSHGAFIAFQDADDLSTPERIEVQMGALEGDPSLGFVLSNLENFHARDVAPPSWFREEAELRSRMGFVNTALVRRETW